MRRDSKEEQELYVRKKDTHSQSKREKPKVTAKKMIKCILGRIYTRKPDLTAAYHSPPLPSNHNNEERFGSEQLVTVKLSTWVAFGGT